MKLTTEQSEKTGELLISTLFELYVTMEEGTFDLEDRKILTETYKTLSNMADKNMELRIKNK